MQFLLAIPLLRSKNDCSMLVLVELGTEFLDRVNQVDLSLAKWFTLKGVRVQGQVDMFNAFNRSPVIDVRSADFGTTAYRQPSRVLQGRLVRFGAQVKW